MCVWQQKLCLPLAPEAGASIDTRKYAPTDQSVVNVSILYSDITQQVFTIRLLQTPNVRTSASFVRPGTRRLACPCLRYCRLERNANLSVELDDVVPLCSLPFGKV